MSMQADLHLQTLSANYGADCLQAIMERYEVLVKEWKEATGGDLAGTDVPLSLILDDFHFVIYGFREYEKK